MDRHLGAGRGRPFSSTLLFPVAGLAVGLSHSVEPLGTSLCIRELIRVQTGVIDTNLASDFLVHVACKGKALQVAATPRSAESMFAEVLEHTRDLSQRVGRMQTVLEVQNFLATPGIGMPTGAAYAAGSALSGHGYSPGLVVGGGLLNSIDPKLNTLAALLRKDKQTENVDVDANTFANVAKTKLAELAGKNNAAPPAKASNPKEPASDGKK